MATRKSNKIKAVADDAFGRALDEWATDNPNAWDDETVRRSKKAQENELADELKRLKSVITPIASPEKPAGKPVISPSKAEEMSSSQVRRFGVVERSRRQVTAEELMAEAFDAIGSKDHNPTAKYVGEGYRKALEVDVIDEMAAGIVEEAEERYGEFDGATSEDLEFLDLMASADVRPLDRGVDRLRTALDERRKWIVEEHALPPTEEDLTEPKLTGAERDLLRRARNQRYVPTLHIRMLRRQEAIAEVARFVKEQWDSKTRFVRVITGKGKHSDGPVVLKPAVIEWVQMDPGNRYVSGWSPETDRSGAWGAMILELRRKG